MTPSLGQPDHHQLGIACRRDQRGWVRLHQQRLGPDAERALHCERGVGQHPARVASVGAGERTHQDQPVTCRAAEPGPEFDCGPIVLTAGEGDDDGTVALFARDKDGDVARRAVQQGGQPGILEQAVRCVDQQQFRVLLGGQPSQVCSGRQRGEGGGAGGHPGPAERRPVLLEDQDARVQRGDVPHGAGDDQLVLVRTLQQPPGDRREVR